MKQTIKEWLADKRDWITAPEINQDEELTEEEYDEDMKRWKAMGVAENYKHQDGHYHNLCKFNEYCRCSQ